MGSRIGPRFGVQKEGPPFVNTQSRNRGGWTLLKNWLLREFLGIENLLAAGWKPRFERIIHACSFVTLFSKYGVLANLTLRHGSEDSICNELCRVLFIGNGKRKNDLVSFQQHGNEIYIGKCWFQITGV